jgi:hypothetical protein
MGMLSEVVENRYFHKFLRSHHPSAARKTELVRVLAERVVDLAPTWDRHLLLPPKNRPGGYYRFQLVKALGLLAVILLSTVNSTGGKAAEDLPEVTRNKVVS